MDAFLLIGLYILVFVGLPVGLVCLFYFVPKKLGYPKTGKYLTLTFGLVVLTLVLWTVFEDRLLTKNNAKELVEEQQIVLTDKFDLKENKSMSAIGDYYHTFTLTISERDKQNAILKIKSADNFKANNSTIDQMLYLSTIGILDQKLHKTMKQKTLMCESISNLADKKDLHQLLDEFQ